MYMVYLYDLREYIVHLHALHVGHERQAGVHERVMVWRERTCGVHVKMKSIGKVAFYQSRRKPAYQR